MISRKKQRVKWIFLGVSLLLISSIVIGYALRDGIEYYKSPTQLINSSELEFSKFRLGGLVEAGSLEKLGGKDIKFSITDNVSSVPVVYTGILPDLFSEKQGVIALGNYKEGVFVAEEILAKHDESYLPKEVIEILKTEGIYNENNQRK